MQGPCKSNTFCAEILCNWEVDGHRRLVLDQSGPPFGGQNLTSVVCGIPLTSGKLQHLAKLKKCLRQAAEKFGAARLPAERQ
jgi:hypothetical protein